MELELLIHKIKGTLSNRPTDKRIDLFLETIFEEYNTVLHGLNKKNIGELLSEKYLQTIEHIEQRILQCFKDYFNGNLYGAIVEMDMLLQDINIVDGFNTSVLKRDDIWYRGRLREDGVCLYKRQEMFHIPEHLREKVNSQRFSFNGYPCLYLGKSIWACWEELDEPHLDDICFSAFKLKENLNLLDLSIPTEEMLKTMSIIDSPKILITLPLAIACSVKTVNEKVNFKSEYIIPQLMMVNLINSRYFEGFVYSSTKKNPALNWKEEYLLNIVLPVMGDFDENGLCKVLKEQFTITSPIYYKYEFLKSHVSNMITASNQEIDQIFEKNYYDQKSEDNEKELYPRALFGQMEDILNNMEFIQI